MLTEAAVSSPRQLGVRGHAVMALADLRRPAALDLERTAMMSPSLRTPPKAGIALL
jgi:hypothetical protein